MVSTDDEEIAYMASFFDGVKVIKRPTELAKDDVPLDPVVYHAVTTVEDEIKKKFDLIFTIQPTSPLLRPETIKRAYNILVSDEYDSLITVQDATHLYWIQSDNNTFKPLFNKRVNRQFLPKIYKETGAIIATKREFLKKTSRLGSRLYMLRLDNEESIDIDSEIDWFSAEQILKSKKIIFRVDGSHKIGLGHIYRALTLAHRLIGHKIYFLMDASKPLGVEKVAEYNYKIITFSTLDEMFNIIDQLQPDIIINDILDTTIEYMYELKKRNIFTVNFEDLGPGADLANIVFNALYEFSNPSENRYFGYQYVVLRDEFIYTPQKEISRDVKKILIIFGGVDQNNLTMKVLEALKLLELKSLEILVIVGLGYKWRDKLERYISELNVEGFKVRFLRNPRIISKYIKESDIAITSNGRTIYEIASIGTPCISISQNERESMHLFAKISGAVMNLGMASSVVVNDIANAIDKLIKDYHLRKTMNEKMKSFNLRDGVKRVIKIIFEKYDTWKGDAY